MHYKSFSDLRDDIVANVHRLHEHDFDLVVGIPRSGMIPAYMIGLILNLNVSSIDGFISNTQLTKGLTRKTRGSILHPWDAKNVLLVDDSIYSGTSMRKAVESVPQNLRDRITTLAIYSTRHSRKDVDFFFTCVPPPSI